MQNIKDILQKIKIVLPYVPTIPFLSIHMKEISILKRYLHCYFHSNNIILRNQDMQRRQKSVDVYIGTENARFVYL